jgi:hypothetical protein
LGRYLKEYKSVYKADICIPMLIATFFTIHKLWNQQSCPTDEWIRKKIYIYIHINTDYYSVTKKNEIMLFVGKWMKLEIIMLNEISQAQKAKYHMFSLICRI